MNSTKPTLIHVIAWTTLVSGIVNIIWGIAALGTFIGFICAPISILPILLGAFELVYAAKLLGTQPAKPSTNIAVFEIACILLGNVFSMAVGILSLVFYNDSLVQQYFADINNGTPSPQPPTPPAPASLPQPEVAPAQPTLPHPEADSATPAPAEEPPAKPKPKRTPRKIAGK